METSALASVRTETTQKNELAKKYSPVISQFAEVSSRIIWYSKSPFSSKHVDVLDSGPLEEGQLDSCVNQLFSYLFIRSYAPEQTEFNHTLKF